jgi:predicted ABC-type ATPase
MEQSKNPLRKPQSKSKVKSSPSKPSFTIVAGPNGVGKSTFARTVLPHVVYINGDEIKRQAKLNLQPMDAFTLRSTIQEKINTLIKERKSFALESNLVSNYNYAIVGELNRKGYETILYYLGADDLTILNQRIEKRVREEGLHYVSPEDVKKRYQEALSKLPSNLKYFDKAIFIDNSLQGKWVTEVLHLANGVIVKDFGHEVKWLKGIMPTIKKLSNAYSKFTARGDDA